MTTTALPFDPTGVAPTNKVVNEQQVITSVNFRSYHYIVPRMAPFFAESLVIGFKNPDGSSRTLTEGVDYYLSHGFISASRACAKPVFGSVEFLSTDLAGVVTLTYQSIGGNWTLDEPAIAAILANNLFNPRTTAWEQIANLPSAFPVIDHQWDLADMVGASDIVDTLDEIRDAISAGGASGLAAHEADKDNPHDVTAIQVGLGNVQNYPVATIAQAQGGTSTTTYMTPFLVAQALTSIGQSSLSIHLNDVNNPHQTTKAQVGLSLVQNYGMADNATAVAGTSSTTYMSPLTTAAVVAIVNQALTNHVSNQLNPHNTTKDQIFLFNVANYPVATAQQAQAGTDNTSYMTPLRVAQAIALQSSTGLQNHLSDTDNPHQTTKVQVGLGNVDNFATASNTDALANSTSNKFMTPQRTYASVMYFVGNDFLTHVNATNPHQVTAAQVGLSNVQNFGLSNQTDAQTGTSNVFYMTPLSTAQAVAFQVGNAFAQHIAQTNPHGTTKTDIGLSLVQNYGIATDSDATAGTSTTTYLTPHGASLLVQAGGLSAHLADFNNPHNTTKNQVGLSNVQNFAIATDAEGTAGTSTSTYATPRAARLSAIAILSPHIADLTNPHQVTANQVGLGLVQNLSLATQALAQAGTDNASYMTPLRTAQAISALASTPITNHILDHANPHQTTQAQVGLSNVQNYPIATTAQAQAGTDTASYMTPALVASALSSLGQVNLNAHLADHNNPHQVTADQLGVYTKTQSDSLLQAKLASGDTAVNSLKLQGSSLSDITSSVNQQISNSLGNFAANVVVRGVLQSNPIDSSNTTNYAWAQLGTLSAMTASQSPANSYLNAIPDLVWLVSGGEDPTALYGVTTLIRVSMRGTSPTDPTLYYAADQTPSLSNGGVDFGYTWNSSTKTVTVYARTPAANNPLTVTELSNGGAAININYLGKTAPAGVVMMGKSIDLQTQLIQLQNDIVSGLAALNTAVANA